MRFLPRPLRLALAVAAAASGVAHAGSRTDYLTRQLENGRDARVRAQAAVMLGALNDPAAATPLCTGLSDSEPVVRMAAASGLGALEELSTISCLEAHRKDSDPEVAQEVQKALKALLAIRDRKPELYIAIDPISDKEGRLSREMIQLADNRFRAKLTALGSLLAPTGESQASAKQTIQRRRLKKAYLLMPAFVSLPNGGLQINVLCLTYPERAILGEVNVRAAGGKSDDLIRAIVPKVIEEVASTFEWSSS
jgi:hypothetical protein